MPRRHLPLPGRVVAITGSARGIGLETANLLLARGAKVAFGDLDEDLVRAAAAGRERTFAGAVDVTDRDSFAAWLEQSADALGPVDVLVNNAGIMPVGPFLDEPDELTRRQIDVNVHGVVVGMKLALPAMLARGAGQIINIGSAASHVGLAGEAVYSGTKHAVYAITEGVRSEYRGSGVDFTVVFPNLAQTELGAGMEPARLYKKLPVEDIAEAIVGAIERPRFEVPIPRDVAFSLKFRRLLPVRVRDGINRVLKIDSVATEVRHVERAGYHERIAEGAEETTAP
jgi:NADP-dependent 3-hydroxy acid dehydrogenase YdfG